MARLFDDGSSEHLKVEQAVLSGAPLAMVCRFNTNDMDNSQGLLFILDKDVDNHYFGLKITSDIDRVRAISQSAEGAFSAIATSSYLINTWGHACGLFVAANDRRVLFDGGNKGIDTNTCTPANMDRTAIGVLGKATPSLYMSGMLAEAAIWDLSNWPGATASDKADNFEKIVPSLAKGFTPDNFPLGLVAYWPLIRGLNDKFGGYNLTDNGTIVIPHPPIIVPQRPQTFRVSHIDVTVTPSTLELVLAQPAPTISIDYTALPTTLELVLAQPAATIWKGIIITPTALELALTQHAPTISIDYTALPATLELELTQYAPTIIIPSDVTVFPATLGLVLTQYTPEVVIRFTEIPPFMMKDLIDPYGSMGAWLWLAEIVVPTQTTQRIARNTADAIYGGVTFSKSNFDPPGRISLTGDGSIPRIQLRVAQDGTGTLENIVNATKGGVNGTVKLIRTCEKYFDTPVAELERTYDILTAESDSMWVTFSLGIPNPLTQRIPLWSYSSKVCPLATPSLFKGPRCQYAGEDTVCTGLIGDCRTKGNAVHWGAEIGLDPNAVRI